MSMTGSSILIEQVRNTLRGVGAELVGIQQTFNPDEFVVVFNVNDANESQKVTLPANAPIAAIYDSVREKISLIPRYEKLVRVPLAKLDNLIARLRDVANGLEKLTENKK